MTSTVSFAAVALGMKNFDSALGGVATYPELWEGYTAWLEDLIRRKGPPEKLCELLQKRALRLCKQAHASGAASARVYLRWVFLCMADPTQVRHGRA